ncbi:MAG: hypothetical protein AB4372_38305 [Xenococcus sp. (in: cyanobacteria)]
MLERFVGRFQPSYRLLAYHAALPLVLTPELVNYLRMQFLRGQVPWVAEVDLLLSDLCRQVGYELYAMDTAVRAYLLEQMKQEVGEGRMQEVARLLISYVKYLHQNNPYMSPKELKAQQWGAMVFLEEKREQVVREITGAFEKSGASTTSKGLVNAGDFARLAKITQELAPQLSYYPNLLDYANLVTKVIARDQNVKPEDLRHYEILDKRLGLPEKLIPDELLEELAVLEDQLKELEPQTSEDFHKNLIQNLSRIDFKEAKYIFGRVFDCFSIRDLRLNNLPIIWLLLREIDCMAGILFLRESLNYGAAIFLLEDVSVMAGELLVNYLRESLKENAQFIQNIVIDFRVFFNDLQSDFLRTLGAFLGITQELPSNQEEYTTQVIEKICSELQNRKVVFLEIHGLDMTLGVENFNFLPWFVHVFWANLISEIGLTVKVKHLIKVKFVAVITSDTSLPPDYIASSDLCTIEKFETSKILKIPLYNWTEYDIEEWLIKYSALPSTRLKLLAKEVYLKSRNGIPRMVIALLQKELDIELHLPDKLIPTDQPTVYEFGYYWFNPSNYEYIDCYCIPDGWHSDSKEQGGATWDFGSYIELPDTIPITEKQFVLGVERQDLVILQRKGWTKLDFLDNYGEIIWVTKDFKDLTEDDKEMINNRQELESKSYTGIHDYGWSDS